jgi:hypothetical protein
LRNLKKVCNFAPILCRHSVVKCVEGLISENVAFKTYPVYRIRKIRITTGVWAKAFTCLFLYVIFLYMIRCVRLLLFGSMGFPEPYRQRVLQFLTLSHFKIAELEDGEAKKTLCTNENKNFV